MEQEYNMRQQGGDMLTAGEEQSTADKVSAALAAEGQSGQAKPALGNNGRLPLHQPLGRETGIIHFDDDMMYRV
ncbi:hypothetical protein NLG97_g9026 [Lecanicillium saksenae]|uniref:Uncharacterized protein n=1 Tax=Lecanicillium saksenae TaxID=468837 RepID=A0ACC1QH74_9HYPO|nr:hypothetical protein NLG97_g9026 [Lecanicillium saksenae]